MTPAGEAQRACLRAVAFDLDGTLADDVRLTFDAFRYGCLPFVGRALGDEEISAHFGPTQEGIAAALAPGHGEECAARFHEFFAARFADYVRPLVGIERLLEELDRQALRSAIVTGAGEASVAVTLRHLELAKSVELVLTGRAEGSCKREQLVGLAQKWGLRPAEVAYVGDAASDMRVAREAGMLPWGAAWAGVDDADALRQAGAEQVFATPDALRLWLGARA